MALPWHIIRAPSSGQVGKKPGATALSHTTGERLYNIAQIRRVCRRFRIKRPTLRTEDLAPLGHWA